MISQAQREGEIKERRKENDYFKTTNKLEFLF